MGKLIIKNPRSFEFFSDHVVIEIAGEIGELSDGYHSYDDLYAHRHELFIALMLSYPHISFRTRRAHDGTETPGWFIAGMNLPSGQITYHLPDSYWHRLDSLPTPESNIGYDGHSSEHVLERLKLWLGVPSYSSH